MVKYLVMDVDGTLTDGKIYTGSSGEMMKAFNVKDGYAIRNILPQYHIEPIIITGRKSEITKVRCKEMGVSKIYQGVADKLELLISFIFGNEKMCSINLANIAYIGDDLPDLECIKKVNEKGGYTGCPADASRELKDEVNYISKFNGGCGAVRDFVSWIIKAQRES